MLTRTTNGALTFSTTENPVLDFFTKMPTLRDNPAEAVRLMLNSLGKSVQDTLRIMFYTRDIRGGQGERKVFRETFKNLCANYPEIAKQVIQHVPTYGRWDDLFVAFDTPVEPLMLEFVRQQFVADSKSEKPSLLAKWLPREKSSEAALATRFAAAFGLNAKWYRKNIAEICRTLKVLEQKLCAKEWNLIQYEQVPSQAMKLYRKAFSKHDPVGFTKYLEAVEKGEKKINASTLFPSQLVPLAMEREKTIETLWRNLPDFTDGKKCNILPILDVSGSMGSATIANSPMSICIGTGLYLAERASGPFKNKFITFSDNPTLFNISEDTLFEKLQGILGAEWGMSTNLQKAVDLVVDGLGKLSAQDRQEHRPDAILIISDMQFNGTGGPYGPSPVQGTDYLQIKAKFQSIEVEMPTIVFWNVASNDTQPALANDKNTVLVSGKSPSVIKYILSGFNQNSPTNLMREVLDSNRYSPIVVS